MEVVFDRPHVRVAERLGGLREPQRLVEVLVCRLLVRPDGREELDAELHRASCDEWPPP